MKPKVFLNLLSGEWRLMVELFEASKGGPIDYRSLLQLIDAHKQPNSDADSLYERLIDLGILGQPLSGETLYQLGGLAETIISQLLQEHRLGLSESIQAYITHLDELSQQLLHATTKHDVHGVASGGKNSGSTRRISSTKFTTTFRQYTTSLLMRKSRKPTSPFVSGMLMSLTHGNGTSHQWAR